VEELEDILRTTIFFMSSPAQIFIFAFTFFLKFPFEIKKCSFFFEVDLFFVNKLPFQELFPFFALTETKLPAKQDMEGLQFRRCASIKSRNHPDAQCPSNASQGDFCQRHSKRPIRFFDRRKNDQRIIYTRSNALLVGKIQRWWRLLISNKRRRTQGLFVHLKDMLNNTTEVYSMEAVSSIPQVFFFSYADAQKNGWAFDIRSLVHLTSQGQVLQNPYTREPLPESALAMFRKRVEWLRSKEYPLLYVYDEVLTPEQIWNQRVLDVFMKIEAMGYLLNTNWFHELSLKNHRSFYRALYQLWTWRLGLSADEKEEICPGYSVANTRLFHHVPEDMNRGHQDMKWWKKKNLNLIHSLVTRGTSKSLRGLGALYVVMGLVQVSEGAADAYPWVLESLGHD